MKKKRKKSARKRTKIFCVEAPGSGDCFEVLSCFRSEASAKRLAALSVRSEIRRMTLLK